MLPTGQAHGGWPASGEIDIMEHVGYDPGRVHVSVHTKAYNQVIGTQKTSITVVSGAMSGFIRYRVAWTPAGTRGYTDAAQVSAFANVGSGPRAWPVDRRLHLLARKSVVEGGGVQGSE